LVRVVHDHDDPAVLALLRAAYRALPSGGVLLLGEPMLGTPGAERVGGAYFEIYLLSMGQGRPRAPQELRQMLQRAGFERSELRPTRLPLQCGLIVAHKSR
jgi:demethylspheroidene O-methyltransferase